jgi:ankyrin repeat protein
MMAEFKELFEACAKNDLQGVTELIQRGTDVDCRNSRRRTNLHYAAFNGRLKMIEHLGQLGADINARDRSQMTPLLTVMLSYATANMLKTIKKARQDAVTSETSVGEESDEVKLTPMALVEKKKIAIVDCLLKLGADINAKCNQTDTWLHEALRIDNVQAVKLYAKFGLHTKVKHANEINASGVTSLYFAVQQGQKNLIKHMVLCGADVNATYSQVPALHVAVQTRNTEIVQTLLDWGAVIGITELRTLTVVFLALNQGQKEMMRHLAYLGADVNATYSRVPLLHTAVQTGNAEIVQTLLDHGANVDSLEFNNVTPASHAVLSNVTNLDTLSCLADLGANLDITYTTSLALNSAATLDNYEELITCLLRHGLDLKTSAVTDWSPVLWSLYYNKIGVLEHLVKCGADVDVKHDTHVATAAVAFIRQGNMKMVKALIQHGYRINETPHKYGVTALGHLVINYLVDFNGPKLTSDTAKLLVGLGADINSKFDYMDFLSQAVVRRDEKMVNVLFDLGMHQEQIAKMGLTLLNYFFDNRTFISNVSDRNMLQLLLNAGANVNTTSEMRTPLSLAVERSDTNMVETLAARGEDMNKTVTKGFWHPLTMACCLDAAYMPQHLIEHGANPNAECIVGIEPLLEALQRCDEEMVQCLLRCGAKPAVGERYRRDRAIDRALANSSEAVRCLIKAGVDLSAKVLYGGVPDLTEGARKIAQEFGIAVHTQLSQEYTLLSKCIGKGADFDILQTLLSHGANKSCGDSTAREPMPETEELNRPESELEYSNLHRACWRGDSDIVRLLLIDGGDMNALDSLGNIPFSMLPLASFADYHTIYETMTTEKVIERVGLDSTPILLNRKSDSLLWTSGLGDVKRMLFPKCTEIYEDVHAIVCEIGKRGKLFSRSEIIRCGSAGEGAKVGLPDEMDFLVEIARIDGINQLNLKQVGDDYVQYSDNHSDLLRQGSKVFHFHFLKRFNVAVGGLNCKNTTVQNSFYNNLIRDSNRRATTPLHMVWRDTNRVPRVTISVDVVPGLHVDNSWPDGGISKTWLLNSDELQRYGYFLVPKPPHSSTHLANRYPPEVLQTLWKISFPHLETYHMQHLEKRIKDVYVLAKCLRNPDVCRIMVTDEGSYPRSVDKFVTSYMLKMAFFKNVEYFLHSDLSLGEMVCRVYDEVEGGLSRGFIPLYFLPKVSALAGHKLDIPKCARVAMTMKKFVHAMNLRESQQDENAIVEDVEEIVVYQRKPSSVYKCIEIALPEDVPEEKLWDCK